jgi:hypothetical protein
LDDGFTELLDLEKVVRRVCTYSRSVVGCYFEYNVSQIQYSSHREHNTENSCFIWGGGGSIVQYSGN